MKRELFIHSSFWFSIFVLTLVIKQDLTLSSWPFFLGGIVGTILPDIDHLIYVYLVKPYELTSQRFGQLLQNRDLKRSVELLYETRSERKNLIFHSKFFQILFLVVTFWLMSSSGSLFGRGVALSFAIHLAVDRMIDIYDVGANVDKSERIYFTVTSLLTVLIGLI